MLQRIAAAVAISSFGVLDAVAEDRDSLSLEHQTYVEQIDALRQIMFCNVDQLEPALAVSSWSQENLENDGAVAPTVILMTEMQSIAKTLRVETAPLCESPEIVETHQWPQTENRADLFIRMQVAAECIKMAAEFCAFSDDLSTTLKSGFSEVLEASGTQGFVPLDELPLLERGPIVFALARCRLRVGRAPEENESICRMVVDDAIQIVPEVSFSWPEDPFR